MKMGSPGAISFSWSNPVSLVKIHYREGDMVFDIVHHYKKKMKNHSQLIITMVVKDCCPAGSIRCHTLLKAEPMPQAKFQLPLAVLPISPKLKMSEPGNATDITYQSAKCMLAVSFVNEHGTTNDPVDIVELVGMGSKMRVGCLYRQVLVYMQRFQSRKRRLCNARYLYRNKTVEYFNDIISHHQGIMHPYAKDWNGDPNNPLNGRIDGLFFMANRFKGMHAPLWSGFGPERILIPLDFLLDNITGQCNQYFSDFYCMKKKHSAHYVSVVFTEPGSVADQFCLENLIPLPVDNPFFRLRNIGGYKVNRFIYVEIFYTKQIDIVKACNEGGATMTRVPSKKTPRPIEGIPKNPDCPECNLRDNEPWKLS